MTQPTHKEVIAWIDSNVEAARKLLSPLGGTDDVTTYVLVSSTASLLANRDVLGLHKPIPYNDGSTFCRACNGVPCPTYLDIAQRLDEVM